MTDKGVTFELEIKINRSGESAPLVDPNLGRQMRAFLDEMGRRDYVEGVVDGIEDPISDTEQELGVPIEGRFDASKVLVFDRSLELLESVRAEIERRWPRSFTMTIVELSDESWANCWNPQGFQPWSTKRFAVFPVPHETEPEEASRPSGQNLILLKDSSVAFGSGEHATTRCLLRLLDDNWDHWRPERVLDVGCGNGILAIAAFKLGATYVLGTEIDEEVAEIARVNAALNDTDFRVEVCDRPPEGSPFDLLIANILAPVLHELMPIFSQQVKCGGVMLLAGFIEKEQGLLIEVANRYGFEWMQSQSENGWMGVSFKKLEK